MKRLPPLSEMERIEQPLLVEKLDEILERSFYKIINVVRTNQVQIRYFGYASAMKCAVQVLEDDASDGKR